MQPYPGRRRWLVSLPTFFTAVILAGLGGLAGGFTAARRVPPVLPALPAVVPSLPPPDPYTLGPASGTSAVPQGDPAEPVAEPVAPPVSLAPCGDPWASPADQQGGVLTRPEQICRRGHRFIQEQGTWTPRTEDNQPEVAVPMVRMLSKQRVVPYSR